jgi:cyclophilin family peptidyl-prolyl cis-trans isomerase
MPSQRQRPAIIVAPWGDPASARPATLKKGRRMKLLSCPSGFVFFLYLVQAPFVLFGPVNQATAAEPVMVELKTSVGAIRLELDQENAPATVSNFVAYVRTGHYDGTIFHRMIPDFVIQGGGLTADLREKSTQSPIANEAANGLKNRKFSVAMARSEAPDSATCQFFINLRDNPTLDHNPAAGQSGYAVFGRVVSGGEVIDQMVQQPTGMRTDPVYTERVLVHVPLVPIVIESAKLVAEN